MSVPQSLAGQPVSANLKVTTFVTRAGINYSLPGRIRANARPCRMCIRLAKYLELEASWTRIRIFTSPRIIRDINLTFGLIQHFFTIAAGRVSPSS